MADTTNGYFCPGEIVFGKGSVDKLASFAKDYASVCVITSTNIQRHAKQIDELNQITQTDIYCSKGEPTLDMVKDAVSKVKQINPACIVAIGGGSILDLAKAVAALVTNEHDVMHYLEVVGDGKPLEADPLPVIAIPTTFGTGSEVTKNSVIDVPDHQRKVSLRSEKMVPKFAIIDPDMSIGIPASVAATSGIDALIHVSEAFVCNTPCHALDAKSKHAIKQGFKYLEKMVNDPDDASRQALADASYVGGLCIANAKLGAVHGLAGVIGGMTSAGHGAICGALFSAVIKKNLAQLTNDNNEKALQCYQQMTRLIDDNADTNDLADIVAELSSKIGLQSLGTLGVDSKDYEQIATKAQASSSMKGNPVELSVEQLIEVLELAH